MHRAATAEGSEPPRRVLVTGAESTGKSTLCQELARTYRTSWCPEYLREYFQQRQGKLTRDDQVTIARGQARLEEEAVRRASRVLFVDTDALLTCVYFEHYFGYVDPVVSRMADEEHYDLILLLHPDVPWVEDPQRDLPVGRVRIHDRLREEMKRRGMRWTDVRGSWGAREQTAKDAVEKLLRNPAARDRR